MATRPVVPRATGEGSIGTAAKHWGNGYFDNLSLAGEDVAGTLSDMDLALAESTGYGIVSGCEPTISGLTVTVGAGVVHLADGTRKELSATNITLDSADSTNPRIDLVYITSAGVVAKVTGTAAASPSVPTLPTGGISVAQVSVAVGATTGTITDSRDFALVTNKNVMTVKEGHFEKLVADDVIATANLKDFAKSIGYHLRSDHTTATENQIKQLINNGAYYIRIPLNWKAVETAQGVYNFAYPLSIIGWIQNNGGKAIVTVTDMPAFYSPTLIGLSTPTIKSAYIAMVSAFITAAKNAGLRGHILDIYNEPNVIGFWSIQDNSVENFVDVTKQAYVAVKAIDASWKIGAPSTSFANFDGMLWTNKAILEGVLDYCDYLLIHNYVDGVPENVIPYLNKLGIMLQQSGSNAEIIVTETGYTTDNTAPFSYATEGNRAKYLPRMLLLNLVFGITGTVLFCAYQDANASTNAEKMFGVITSDGTLTTSATAVKDLVDNLDGYKFYSGEYHNDYLLLQFVNAVGGDLYIAWAINADMVINVDGQNINITTTPTVIDLPSKKTIVKQNKKVTLTEINVGGDILCNESSDYSLEGYNGISWGVNNKLSGNTGVVLGTNSHSNDLGFAMGAFNSSYGGDILEITSITDNKIYLNTTGLNVGDKLLFGGEWVTPSINNILSVESAYITIDENVNSNWTFCVKKQPNRLNNVTFGANNVATGYAGAAFGQDNWTYYQNSATFGIGNRNILSDGIVGGRYSKTENSDDTLLKIGNGTTATRSNAFRVNAAGAVYGQSAYNATGADYAEYFEWADDNAEDEDRVGYFVTFDSDNKIRLANANDDYILGIVSGNPATLGNSYNDQWQNMYVMDDFGRIQYEDVEVEAITDGEGNIIVPAHSEKRPVINPDYDNTQEYVGRENRKEWSAVGMLGVLPVRDDGTCEVNGYCKVADGGIATKTTSGYRVIERVSENVVKIVFR